MSRAPRPLAIAYHGVATVPLRQDTAGLFTPVDALVDHIRRLRRWGYRFVTFGQLAEAAAAANAVGLCALTFDDGLADNASALLPVLEREEVPATVFVVSTWLGVRHPDAPWARTLVPAEIRRLAEGPVEIGSHSATHRDLSALPYGVVVDDLSRSKAALEDIVGRPVSVAAYPYGLASEETGRACAEAGFVAACRISGEGSWADPMHLPRENMHNSTSGLGLFLKQRGAYEPLTRRLPGRAVRSGARRLRSLTQRRWPLVPTEAVDSAVG